MRAFFLVVLAFVLVALVLAGAARAQQPDARTESERQHFSAGVKLYDAKDYPGALEQFRLAFADKPSPGIKRNIALCFKEMHKYPEAIDALQQMLAEGGDTLKPEVQAGARAAIAQMMPLVASLRITIRVHTSIPNLRAPIELSIDELPVPVEHLDKSVLVMPGAHTVHARATGFQDVTLALKVDAGAYDVPATLDLLATALAGVGRLTVRTTTGNAEVSLDGVVVGQVGEWSGDVPAGTHHVVVTAPGYEAFVTDVAVAANEAREVPVALTAVAAPPKPPPPPERVWYVMAGFTLASETLTLGPAFSAGSANTKLIGRSQGFGGLGLAARVGRKLGPTLMLEMLGEIGAYGATFTDPNGQPARITITDWVLAPELRFRSHGNVRFVGGAGVGVEGQATDASVVTQLPPSTTATEVSGSGVSGALLVEAGLQGGVRRTFFEGSLFLDVHGVGSANDRTSRQDRVFYDSPAVRLGLRLLVGFDL